METYEIDTCVYYDIFCKILAYFSNVITHAEH